MRFPIRAAMSPSIANILICGSARYALNWICGLARCAANWICASAMRAELDLRLGEMRAAMATKVELAEAKGEILKWLFGAVGVQTLAILGGVAALFRLLG